MGFFEKRYTKDVVEKRYGEERTVRGPNVALMWRDGLLAFAVFALLVTFWPLRTVDTGTRGVITIGGKITSIEEEGFHLVWPWEKLSIFNVRAEEANVDKAEGSTADTQPVSVSLTVRYSIEPTRVAEVFEKYSHDGNLSSYVQTAVQETFKAVTARYTAPDLVTKRADVSNDIATGLGKKLQTYGAKVVNIDMRNFAFSPSYMAAINEKVTQEQLAKAADNKLKTVENEQKQKVAVAEAEAQAAKAKADGEAYAQLTVAKATAEALRVQNQALAQNRDVLELKRIEVELAKAEKWDGKLPQNLYAGAPMPFLQLK